MYGNDLKVISYWCVLPALSSCCSKRCNHHWFPCDGTLAAYVCYIVHAVVVYSFAVKTIGGISPLTFFKEMLPAIMFAFSSASSVGTLPINMECTEKLGTSREIASLSFHLVQQSTWTELPFIRVYVRFLLLPATESTLHCRRCLQSSLLLL